MGCYECSQGIGRDSSKRRIPWSQEQRKEVNAQVWNQIIGIRIKNIPKRLYDMIAGVDLYGGGKEL